MCGQRVAELKNPALSFLSRWDITSHPELGQLLTGYFVYCSVFFVSGIFRTELSEQWKALHFLLYSNKYSTKELAEILKVYEINRSDNFKPFIYPLSIPFKINLKL